MQKKEVFIFGSAFSLYQLVIKRGKFWRSFYLWLSSSFYCEFVGDQPNGENLLSPSRTWLRFRMCSIFFAPTSSPQFHFFAIQNNWIGEDCSIASIGILLASVLMREGVAAKQIYNHNEINSKLHKVNQLQNSKRCKFLSKEKKMEIWRKKLLASNVFPLPSLCIRCWNMPKRHQQFKTQGRKETLGLWSNRNCHNDYYGHHVDPFDTMSRLTRWATSQRNPL